MKYGISKIRISEIKKGVYVPPVDEEADFTANDGSGDGESAEEPQYP